MLNSSEQNYGKMHRECFAVVGSMILWTPRVEGQRFTICADCVALDWILSLFDSTVRLDRERLGLLKLNFHFCTQSQDDKQADDSFLCLKNRGNGQDTA